MSTSTWRKTVDNEGLAKWAVKQFYGPGLRTKQRFYHAPKRLRRHYQEDLEQEALLAIHKASEHFDESLGYKFSTYAAPIIGEALKKAVRKILDPLKAEDPHIKSTRPGARKREKTRPDTPGTGLHVRRTVLVKTMPK